MDALQAQEEELHKLAPVLAPSSLPRGVAGRDLLSLAEQEGEQGAEALLHVLAAAADDVEECGICGEAGEVALDPDEEPSDALPLRFTLLLRMRFEDRALLPTKALFACGLCRSLRQTGSLVSEMACVAGQEDEDTVEGLLEHLAEVNKRTDLAENPEACYTWAQQLLSRAYALQIAASSMSGWRLCHPGGKPVERETPGAAASLALELLLPEASPAERAAALTSALQQSDEEADEEMHMHTSRENLAPSAIGKVNAKKSKKRKSTTEEMTSAKSEGKVPAVEGQMPLRRRKQKRKGNGL